MQEKLLLGEDRGRNAGMSTGHGHCMLGVPAGEGGHFDVGVVGRCNNFVSVWLVDSPHLYTLYSLQQASA